MIPRLLLLSFLVAMACSKASNEPVSAIMEDGKVTSIRISATNASSDSINVFVRGSDYPVLGEFKRSNGQLVFTPTVHFTTGQIYEARNGTKVIGSVEVPLDESISAPALLSVYPSGDSIAENTLKMYFKFSEPMREGVSSKHIHMLRDGRDTMSGTFLDLQPELWNDDGTILTLWLDPGRIKRDLIPNKKLGNPLSVGANYTLLITRGWRSKAGKPTGEEFRKVFRSTGRDEASPRPQSWKIQTPRSGTVDPLTISFEETLDYMLIVNAIHILGPEGAPVAGEPVPGRAERSLQFTPSNTWKIGTYTIEVQERLEDTAGNNLSRLFDEDITKTSVAKSSKLVRIEFEVI